MTGHSNSGEAKDSTAAARRMIDEGLALFEDNRFEEALVIMETALMEARQNGLMQEELLSAMILAEQLKARGMSLRALHFFHEVLELGTSINEAESVSFALKNLGQLYLEKGWAEQARICFQRAADFSIDDQAQLAGSLGLCLQMLGKYDEAIECFSDAYRKASQIDDLFSMTICAGNCGNAYFEKKDYENARKEYENAYGIAIQTEDLRQQGIWLGNIGLVEYKQKKLDQARVNLERAIIIAEDISDSQSQACHLDSLGDYFDDLGDKFLALEKYLEALELAQANNDKLGERHYFTSLGRCYLRHNELVPAYKFLTMAADLFDEQRSVIRSDDLKTSFGASGNIIFENLIKTCLGLGKRVEALEFLGRSKSRALLDLLVNSPVDINVQSDADIQPLIEKEKSLREQISILEHIYDNGDAQENNSDDSEPTRGGSDAVPELKEVYKQWRAVVDQLKIYSPNYADVVGTTSLDFAGIKKLWSPVEENPAALGKETALVEFFLTEEVLLTALVRNDSSEPSVHFINDREKIDKLHEELSAFCEMATTPGFDLPKSLSKRIYEALFGDLLDFLPESGISHLLLVPHGDLFHLPFAALNNGEYLCQRFDLSLVPSSSLISLLNSLSHKAEKEESKYAIFAVSDYSNTRKNKDPQIGSLRVSARRSAGLEDLKFTRNEAEAVVKASGDSNSKLVTEKDVRDFSALFSCHSIVHFAGHAFFNNDEPLASGLVLPDGSMITASSILERNSLKTRCGKLLVLSACQTGVNAVTGGSEILGMARSLIYAGMPNLVLSLWEVGDQSTAQFMSDFHTNLNKEEKLAKLPVSKSLGAAQKSAIDRGEPVFSWAPFIHIGID